LGLALYAVKKLAKAFSILLISISLMYVAVRSIPGDPVTVLYGESAPDPAARAQLEKALGLDAPLPVQIFNYFSRLLRGDMGRSIYHGVYVSDLIAGRIVNSLILAAASSVIMVLLTFAAAFVEFVIGRGSKVLAIISSVSASLPTLGWGSIVLAVSIYSGLRVPIGSIVGPLIVLSVVGFGFFYRYLRAMLVKTLASDAIITYRALGCPEWKLFAEALRIALPEFLSVVLYRFGLILFSAVVVESVFQYPGMGSLFVLAIQSRDYPVLLGWGVVAAVVAVAVNTAVDIVHAFLDPRVKLYE